MTSRTRESFPVPPQADPGGPATLAAALRAGARLHGDAPMVFHRTDGTVETTLGALHEKARRVAAGLAAAGVGPGDVVAVQLTSREANAVAVAATLLRGAVLLPIVPVYGPREVGFVLRQSGACALVTTAARAGKVLGRDAEPPELRAVFVVPDHNGDTAPVPGATAWTELEACAPAPECGAPGAAPDDVCLLVYTSGTTADPKGVQHTHRSLLAELATLQGVRGGGDPGFRYLDAFPPGHVAGVAVLLRALAHGRPTVFMERWDAGAALELITRYAVTASAGVPFHLAALLDAAESAGRDLGELRDYLVGAASVPPVLVERAAGAGIAAYRSYGSSEHPTVTSGSPADPAGKRAGTDGRPLPGTEVRVVDGAGDDLPPGRDGEILTRGPELFAGYRDPALNAAAFTPDGWLRTGDVGHLDADGHLTITDRLKDIIVRGGENISSKEVEDLLATHPAVAEAAAVARPDERYGERVCVFVVLRPGGSLELADVREHFAAAGAARQKIPEYVVAVAELPRTAAGKVRKHELRARLRE